MAFGDWDLSFRVQSLDPIWLRVWGLRFRVLGFRGLRFRGLGFGGLGV